MSKRTAPYHFGLSKVYHIFDECPAVQEIPWERRIGGKYGRRICNYCATIINAELESNRRPFYLDSEDRLESN